jgi:hypothetical protein
MVAGCGVGQTLPVALIYTPDQTVQSVNQADSVQVEVTVKDLRQNKATVGDAQIGFNIIPVVIYDDPTAILKSAVDAELRDRGFKLGSGNAQIEIDLVGMEVLERASIDAFAAAFGTTNVSSSRAIVVIATKVRRVSGTILYNKSISGKITLPRGVERPLDYALDNAVRNLMNDPDFIKALLATRKTVKPAATAPPHAAPKPAPPNKR